MTASLRTIAVAAAALATVGCAALAPPVERPAVAGVPARYAVATPAAGAVAADLHWRDFYADPRLQALQQAALEHHRDLRVALLDVERARAVLRLRRADRWPGVGAAVGAEIQGRDGGGSDGVYTAGLAVSAYELDLFGRVRNLSDAAAAQLLATDEARRTAQISLLATVADAWLAVLADDALLALTRRTLALREDALRLTQLQFDNGTASGLDVEQFRSLVEAARVALAQLARQRAQDDNLLVLLTGRGVPPPDDAADGAAALDTLRLGPELAPGLPSDLLERRPDIRAAEAQLAAAAANVGAARAAFFPRITLTGTAGTVSTALSGLFESGSWGWTFVPQVVLPLFDAGRNDANLAIAQVDREVAVAQYQRAVQTAFREVADALAGRATWDEQLRAQRAQAAAEAERMRLTGLRFQSGVASHFEVLDAQRSVFAAQQLALQTQLARLRNRVALYRALGGGWQDAAPAP